jgi:putative DNA primase/helicase
LIVVAPSIHSSGNQYMWLEGHSPFDIEPAEAPVWLINLMTGKLSVKSNSNKPVPEGNRNNHLTSLAGTLRRKGMSEVCKITDRRR